MIKCWLNPSVAIAIFRVCKTDRVQFLGIRMDQLL